MNSSLIRSVCCRSALLAGIYRRTAPTCRSLVHAPAALSHPASSYCTKSNKEPVTDDGANTELSFDEELKQLSLFQRYKKLGKEYWYVLIPVHCCTSILWFSSCLAVVYTGVDIDLVWIAEKLHLPEGLVKPLRNPNLGKLAVALMLYKLVSPLRYMSTVYATVPSIKWLVRRELIKPVPRLTSKKQIDEEIRRFKNRITKKRGED